MPDLERKDPVIFAPTAFCTLCDLSFHTYLERGEIYYKHQVSMCTASGYTYKLYGSNQVYLLEEEKD